MATIKDHSDRAETNLALRRWSQVERLATAAMWSPVLIGAAGYFVARTNDSDVGRWTAWSLAVVMVFGLFVIMALTALRRLGANAMGSRGAIVLPLALGAVMAIVASGVAFRSAPVAAIGFLAVVTGLYVLGIRWFRNMVKTLLSEDETSR